MEPGPVYARQVLGAVERAMARSAAAIHQDLKSGLTTMATITSVAPFVGILGTLWGIVDSFPGFGTEKSTVFGIVTGRLSLACVPAALGLLVGLQSLCCYKYLQGRIAGFDREMQDTIDERIDALALRLGRQSFPGRTNAMTESLPFFDAYAGVAGEDGRSCFRSAVLTMVLLAVAWSLQVVHAFGYDSLPIPLALQAAVKPVLVAFALSCIPAYAIWVDILHRKGSTVAPLAAALCLCWSASKLFVPFLAAL